jgi:hypothetical protein
MTQDQLNAIYKLYGNITNTLGDVAYDANGNVVSYDANAVQAYIDNHAYISKRQREYPPITDYLDGVVKGDQEQIDDYIAACQAVKTKYPKPE